MAGAIDGTMGYDYEDVAPDFVKLYGYEVPTTSDHVDAYDYGDAVPDVDQYGYGDGTPRGSSSNDNLSAAISNLYRGYEEFKDSAPLPQPERRTRCRRRGSVTEYSLDDAETVKKEFGASPKDHDTMSEEYRAMNMNCATSHGLPQDFPGVEVLAVGSAVSNSNSHVRTMKPGRLRRFTLR